MRRLVAADWSKHAGKRWYCVATPCGDGFDVDGPFPVEDDFLKQWEDRPTLVGVDFAIGLPREYCQRAGIAGFVQALPTFDAAFFMVSDEPSLGQPFYPRSATGTRARLQQVTGELRRRCDALVKACPIFWTLGAQQVGRATIHGWQTLLQGRAPRWKLWPFDGDLDSMPYAIAECYPRLGYHELIGRRFAKSSRDARAAQAPLILAYAARHGLRIAPSLQAHIESGFDSDDPFDACLAVMGMTAWVRRPVPAPQSETVRRYEGWILGLPDPHGNSNT
jgi:hypothetical protein